MIIKNELKNRENDINEINIEIEKIKERIVKSPLKIT